MPRAEQKLGRTHKHKHKLNRERERRWNDKGQYGRAKLETQTRKYGDGMRCCG